MKENNHLPLFGVGPVIVYGQFIITAAAIFLVKKNAHGFGEIHALDIPFLCIGIALIAFGIYLNFNAKVKSKLFQKVAENQLITDGVYAVVRNPVYSAALLGCTGAVFIVNNLLLMIVPVICWIYVTVFLIQTEEKWLADLYGEAYHKYCKSVNRCIPWFPKK
ncbi:MAG: isoprenylcysteine carboxylmethyltransferase family protein [Oscillospiraceae bacterium]|nr:isoprenylcysteine carboxylmethyltransferase family protein [Oscillospiraceae bacterium]